MTIHETMLSTFAEICAELAVRGPSTLSTQTVCFPQRSNTVAGSSLTATQRCCGVSLPTLKKMTGWIRPGIWKCGCWRI